MPVANTAPNEPIVDIYGRPIPARGDILLKALDKLLTLEAYYSDSHDQYIAATEEATRIITRAIQPDARLAVEITAKGLMIMGQTVDPEHRHARQLMDLMAPLNIAMLEIHAALSAVDLRQAVAILQEHRKKVGRGRDFQEVVIQNMPPTIRSVSRSVLRQNQVQADKSRPRDQKIPGESEGEKLARRFLAMVSEILNNLKEQGVAHLNQKAEGHQVDLTAEDLEELRLSLKQLLDFNPSPRELADLISTARQALELSKDPYRTDMVFQILRRDILLRAPSGPQTGASVRVTHLEELLDTEQIQEALAELEALEVELPGPGENAPAAQLAICLSMLQDNPTEALRQSIQSTLVAQFKRPGTKVEDLTPCLDALVEALEAGFLDWVEVLLEVLPTALRQGRPALLAPFWAELQERSSDHDLEVIWPRLMNDILLGLGRHDKQATARVVAWAGTIKPTVARNLLPDLKNMPALQREKAAPDLFLESPVKMYPALQALAHTQLASWLSKGLHASLRSRPANRVVKVLLRIMDHHPSMLELYLDLVAQPSVSVMSGKLRSRAALMIMNTLENLPRSVRSEDWVEEALEALAELEVEESRQLFLNIVSEKRLVFGHGWPAPSRAVAERALAAQEVLNG
jgi:hypothetical protein